MNSSEKGGTAMAGGMVVRIQTREEQEERMGSIDGASARTASAWWREESVLAVSMDAAADAEGVSEGEIKLM